MTSHFHQKVCEVFVVVVAVSQEQRASKLDELCKGDSELRKEVEKWLLADAAGEGVLQTLAKPDKKERDSMIGVTIASKYKIREKLGEGGMGAVYVADQIEPIERRVALKLIRKGADSNQLIARFDHERQAIAMMDHPNIAKVLDAGIDDDLPFFVMELIKGVPITDYCDESKLTLQQRIELFIPVCQAVQHAHQKGIIHRDLKPSNILVAQYDDELVPKIIDFGVAKATGPRLTDETIYTEVGQMIGTLEYMSPEQAKLNNLDIDTRSDIYSLGVILYELLTGSVPFNRKTLETAGLGEMLRMIKEDEPDRPSTKVSKLGLLPSVASVRKLEPKRLPGVLRGELDWIVLKCLEKERVRRYETASQLAAELHSFLSDKPVQAGPPTAYYRLSRFYKRNRIAVVAWASILTLLLISTIVSSSLAFWAVRAERRAQAMALSEQSARRLEEAQTRQLVKSIEIISLMTSSNDILSNNQHLDQLSQLLKEYASSSQPETGTVQDRGIIVLMHYVGDLYHNKSMHDKSLSIRRIENQLVHDRFPTDNLLMVYSLGGLSSSYLAIGEIESAHNINLERLSFTQARLGLDNVHTMWAMHGVADTLARLKRHAEAIPILESCFERVILIKGEDALLLSVADLLFNSYYISQMSTSCLKFAIKWEGLNRTDAHSLICSACYRAFCSKLYRVRDANSKEATEQSDQALRFLKRAVEAGSSDARLVNLVGDVARLYANEEYKKLKALVLSRATNQK